MVFWSIRKNILKKKSKYFKSQQRFVPYLIIPLEDLNTRNTFRCCFADPFENYSSTFFVLKDKNGSQFYLCIAFVISLWLLLTNGGFETQYFSLRIISALWPDQRDRNSCHSRVEKRIYTAAQSFEVHASALQIKELTNCPSKLLSAFFKWRALLSSGEYFSTQTDVPVKVIRPKASPISTTLTGK